MDEYSKNEYDYYFFEKNAFGDIIAVYNANGTKIGTYTYDAWGNICSTTCLTTDTTQKWVVESVNPFRYRGYFYDVETGLYYLQSRYYNPELGRFISADCYIATGQGLLGNNMYIYCNNNPIMYTDPTGEAPKWFKKLTDRAVSLFAEVAGGIAGTCSFFNALEKGATFEEAIREGKKTKLITSGAINNAVNAFYYEICSGESDLKSDSYRDGYVSRWDRLNYTKAQTKAAHYTEDVWLYYSEYSAHMYVWLAIGWTENMGIPFISEFAGSAGDADVKYKRFDEERWYVKVATLYIGARGW